MMHHVCTLLLGNTYANVIQPRAIWGKKNNTRPLSASSRTISIYVFSLFVLERDLVFPFFNPISVLHRMAHFFLLIDKKQ